MACLFRHNWGWPRRRGDRHMQVCLDCGAERESRVQFDTPRYASSQEPRASMGIEGAANGRQKQIVLPHVA